MLSLNGNLLSSVIVAAGMGLAVSLVLWLLRTLTLVQRVRISVLGFALALGVYIVLLGAGASANALSVRFAQATAILLATNAVLQALDVLLWNNLVGRRRGLQIPRLLIDVFNVAVLAGVLLAILYRIFNVNLTALVVTSTVVSAVIGLSLQDTLGNIIAGLALQMDRPFSIGDWANISGIEGEVMRMNWRTITLRTIDNNHIVVSNANTARHDIVNYSRPTVVQRLSVQVGLSYTYPPGEVKRVLNEAVRQAEGVLTSPAPDVLLSEYADSAIVYKVRYWIDDYPRKQVIADAVLTRIWYAIRREGMSVPFPIRDVTVRQLGEDHEEIARADAVRECYAELRPLSIFASLTDEQIQILAERARTYLYTQGEVLVKQGDTGDSLFVIKCGVARVEAKDDLGRVTELARIPPGDFFGEMSLVTGERRSASVVAAEETEVVVVDKNALAEVLAGDFDSLEALSEIVEKRMEESAARKAELAVQPIEKPALHGSSLTARIQSFLGIR